MFLKLNEMISFYKVQSFSRSKLVKSSTISWKFESTNTKYVARVSIFTCCKNDQLWVNYSTLQYSCQLLENEGGLSFAYQELEEMLWKANPVMTWVICSEYRIFAEYVSSELMSCSSFHA